MMRAAFRGVAFGLRAGLDALHDSGVHLDSLKLAGGGSLHPAWRQLLADTLNCNLSVLPQANASARGAALLGGMAAGHWRQPDLAALALAANTVVQPHAGAVEAAALGYHRFLAVYGRLADGP